MLVKCLGGVHYLGLQSILQEWCFPRQLISAHIEKFCIGPEEKAGGLSFLTLTSNQLNLSSVSEA